MFYNLIIEDKDGNERCLIDTKNLDLIKLKVEKFKNFEDFLVDGYLLNRKEIKRIKITYCETACLVVQNLERNNKDSEYQNASLAEIAKNLNDMTDDLIKL